jgi:hypothetical protein
MKYALPFQPLALTLALAAALGGCSSMKAADADAAASEFSPFTVAVIGDTPYGTSPTDTKQFAQNPQFIAAINADADVSTVIHVGDIHSGKQYCTQEYNQAIFQHWSAFKQPLVYTPGDNEWIDCHKAKQGGGKYNKATQQIDYVMDAAGKPASFEKGDPIANLGLVRSIFFASPGQTLGGAMAVRSQAQEFDPKHPTDKAYVENVMWEKSGVLFVTLNIPGGSNNGTDPWYGTSTMGAAQQQEVAQRTGATLRWIDAAFKHATTKANLAVVILTQGDMWDIDEADTGAAHLSGFKPYLDKIAEHTKAYGLPVLTVLGDSHIYRSDNPLVKDAPCTIEPASGQPAVACTDTRAHAALAKAANPTDPYMAQPHGYNVPNFHRIVVHGEVAPREWLKLRVDPLAHAPAGPDAFGPFSWVRVQPTLGQ